MAKKTFGDYFVIKRDKKVKPPKQEAAPKNNLVNMASKVVKDYEEQLMASGIISKPADLAKFKPSVTNENRFICEIKFCDSKSNDRYITINIGKTTGEVLNASVHFQGITKPISAVQSSKPKKK